MKKLQKTSQSNKKEVRRNDILINIFVLAVTLVLVFLFLELFFRFYVYTVFDKNDDLINFIQESNNSRLAYELKPNSQGYIYDKKVEINQNGERGKLYPYGKPKETTRIVFIGDSITFGFGSLINESYPYLVEDSLNKKYTNRFEAIDLGVYSYNTVQQVESLKVKGLRYSPDIVVVGFYISNPEGDFNRLNPQVPKRKILHATITSLSKHSYFFKYALDTFRMLGIENDFSDIYDKNSKDWKNFEAAINDLESLSKKNDFKVVFVIHPQLYNFDKYHLNEYHNTIRSLAESKGFIVLDMLDYYKEYDAKKLKAAKQDYSHPNHLGNIIISKEITDTFIKNNLLAKY